MNKYKQICDIAGVSDIGDVDDGYHSFNDLYLQRCILFATIVNSHKELAWKTIKSMKMEKIVLAVDGS